MPSLRWKLVTIAIIAFGLILFRNHGQARDSTDANVSRDPALAKELSLLQILNQTEFDQFRPSQDRWLNLTGFRQSDGLSWTVLAAVKERASWRLSNIFGEEYAKKIIDTNLRPEDQLVYRNVTGFVTGKWVRSPIEKGIHQAAVLNSTALLPSHDGDSLIFNRNISGPTGRIDVVLRPSIFTSNVSGTTTQSFVADVTIADKGSKGDGWEFQMTGVNIVESGSTFLTTTSNKFDGIFGLPNFALSTQQFDDVKQQLNTSINRIITNQRQSQDSGLGPWLSTIEEEEDDFAHPNCEIIMYLQQHRPELVTPAGIEYLDATELASIEHELRFPRGQSQLRKPELIMSMLAFSPDCGFVIESRGGPDYFYGENAGESNHLTGLKSEILAADRRNIALLFAIVLLAQLYLQIGQMTDAATPSTRSRISIWTISILAWGDGLISMVLLPLGIGPGYGFPTMLGVAFLAFMGLTFFDLRFMMDVWSVQLQEQRRLQRRDRDRARTTSDESNLGVRQVRGSSLSDEEGLPLPVTSRQAISSGATPIILTSDQDELSNQQTATMGAGTGADTEATAIRRQMSGLYVRFYLLLFGTVFLSLNASTWRTSFRSAYTNFLVMAYLSWPLPQIYRNAIRHCRKALQWKFVVGQSLLRIAPIAYLYGIPRNVFYTQIDLLSLSILAAWVWIQICLLVAQNLFSPQLLLPESWVPPAYDYHPILREGDEEAKLPLLARRSSTTEDCIRSFDCAICMQDIEIPILATNARVNTDAAAQTFGSAFLARRAYMVTPCRHIFHTECLESAMKYRLQCPVCRESLPSI